MRSESSSPGTHRTSLCPSLPPEIWIHILNYNTDLTHLWTTCRRVSQSFRACTEQVFANYVLRDTYIDFQLEKYNLGGKSKRPEVPCSFARFDLIGKRKDGEIRLAIFKDNRKKNEIGGGKKKEYDKIMERWEENVRNWKPEMPNYTVRVGTMVNDIELPGLDIDIRQREINFDWRKMFQLFFREQERLRVLKRKWNADTAKKIQSNNQRLAKGEKLSLNDIPQQWPTAEVEVRKEIRRTRLKEYYAGNEEMIWAIDSLKHFENHGGSGGNSKAFNVLPDLPGAGVGEKWFGSVNLVQGLCLDEWSCMHRIDTKVEHLKGET